ncbi:hypothetical protein BDFB_008082 [Asbolus verrucosus]|uniref:Uncharacterized protein n=1 Tax=Asbolus verrucosus TaxID=1661398 RepID=A0A482VVP0_ASBVE|nr:hypothetical protein BDFB_008082 [Asbolus verrucosus]
MMATDSLNDELTTNSQNNLECASNGLEISETSSDTGSEISLSEKIVLESNEKRLQKRMTTLQSSIMNLKEQLKLEKELWREDMERIRELQKQQQEMRYTCPVHHSKSKDIFKIENSTRSNSIYSLMGNESSTGHHISKHGDEIWKTHSIKQLLELQNYKRKLTETENMCNLELNRVKQSLQDLKTLQNISSEWGIDEKEDKKDHDKTADSKNIEEIYMCNTAIPNKQ